MIIHVDTGKTWRGGQQQAFYLHTNLYQSGYASVMVCKKNSVMSERCKTDNLPFMNLPLSSEFDVYSAAKLASFTRRNNGKILHLHTAHALSIGLITKFFYRKVKLIAVRRVDFHIKKYSKIKYNNNFLDVLVCISKNISDVVISDGINPDKLRIIHSGIDIDWYKVQLSSPPAPLKFGENRFIIGTIAALADHKDYPTLLRAAKIVTDQRMDITFVACGDGEQKDKLMILHKELGLKNRFIFTGFQTDIKKYLHSFDIFVLSSKLEGLGTSVLDAMSAGKPIVACKSGGIPEMIKHGINGLLAEKENPQDLAEKLLRIIDDKELREKLAHQAQDDVKEFSIQNTILKNIKIYNEL